jgi:hypothetical protein
LEGFHDGDDGDGGGGVSDLDGDGRYHAVLSREKRGFVRVRYQSMHHGTYEMYLYGNARWYLLREQSRESFC